MKDKLINLAARWNTVNCNGMKPHECADELLAILDTEGDGVVSDEDVEAACVAYARKAAKHIAVSPACMRAALEHFAKGERHER